VLRQGDVPNDEILEYVQRFLHGWMPEESMHCYEQARVLGDELVPHSAFLVMETQVTLKVIF